MKLHYKGNYDLNPESLPRGSHQPDAHPFKEVKDTRTLAVIANIGCLVLIVLLGIPAFFRCREFLRPFPVMVGSLASLLALFPHELLHAVCFRDDVYLYLNLKQGMLFVVGPETMSKGRFLLMSLLPNLIFGFLPYLLGMIFPQYPFLLSFGILCAGMGFGDYYNVFNALTQMPKGARTYLYQFHSYWYLPQ